MTRPGRPFSTWTVPPGTAPGAPAGGAPDAGGASADSLPPISPAQPWTRRARPITRLPRPRLVIGGVSDQHGLRHRVVAVVGKREEHPPASLGLRDRATPAAQHHGGRLPALAPHLELAPLHAHAEPGAERLEGRLLGREARGQVGNGIAAPSAVLELLLGEHPLQE